MDFTNHRYKDKQYSKQYSNSSSKELNNSNSTVNSTVNSNSTVTTVEEIFKNLVDVIPVDDFMPFYVSRYKQLGTKRFIELANMARRNGKNPQRLFFWYLKNNHIVK